VCYCGLNIGTTVDVEAVAAALSRYPGVEVSTTYKYMCSDPGQQLIRQKVEEHQLDRFIVAACTPNLHLRTYRNLAASLGLNPYKTEQANIRGGVRACISRSGVGGSGRRRRQDDGQGGAARR
jgi:heterodisulfide reductase subunit A